MGSIPFEGTLINAMKLPVEIATIIKSLNAKGFEAYAVGGCVRDLILSKKPKDWDITTSAKPEQIQEIFPENFYENTFGTVTVKTGSEDETLKQIQITPYRIEGRYTDKRHPGEIEFVTDLADDLSRRDFSINSLAIDKDGIIKDLYNGQEDIKNKIVRTVGKPKDRFDEDALRILRAVRFATILGFQIDTETVEAIKENAGWLAAISKERVRDEFIKIINSDNAYSGVLLLEELGLLLHIVPELREGINVGQNLHHIYTVWEHNLLALKYCTEKKYSLEVRLAALFHDIGKPQTKNGNGHYSTFYGHDVVGAKITAKLMERLKFSRETIEKVTKLVRYHLFYYNVGEVTESSVRRLLANIGPENMEDLIKVREADRIGSGVPKAMPYKLRHLKYIIDKVSHDPISAKMLKINGNDLMNELGIAPGPKVGLILSTLLAEVLDKPENNQKELLINRIRELDKKSPEELRESLKKIEKAIELEEQERMKKYYV
ncbi:MAG: PolyA polymerase family protein [Parcubacteria group bacterium GW2011_GWC1_39_29]|nr:MAG: PolyA polymerase family protein [Parcubacteria group bacterium GW2011_GWC1_39_29]